MECTYGMSFKYKHKNQTYDDHYNTVIAIQDNINRKYNKLWHIEKLTDRVAAPLTEAPSF